MAQSDKTVQDIKDLTSNTVALLKDFGVPDTAVISALGGVAALVVTAAASGGTLAIVAAVVGIASQIFSLFQSSSDELAKIQQQLAQILQAAAQEADIQRKAYIQQNLSPAKTAADSFKDLANSVPLSSPQITTQMQAILGSMNALAPVDVSNLGCQGGGDLGAVWSVPYYYQTYWSDDDSQDNTMDPAFFGLGKSRNGYGEQAPANSGEVFNHTYILPAYLYAVSTFVSVGTLIDPDFQLHWADDVASAACLLQSVHDYIQNSGMKQLSPGPCSYQNLSSWSQLPGLAPFVASQTPSGVILSITAIPIEVTGITIEYGAVEKFSGVSSMGLYKLQWPLESNENYDGAFQIRLKRRWKDVYLSLGLKHLQDAIDSLNKLINKPTSARPSPGDWSFRHDIGPVFGPATTQLHLSDVMAYLRKTAPADWQGSVNSFTANSFRNMLSF